MAARPLPIHGTNKVRVRHPLMAGERARQMKALEEHNKQREWTEFRHKQRLHEQAINLTGELQRLSSQHNRLLDGVMGNEPHYAQKRLMELRRVKQKISKLNK